VEPLRAPSRVQAAPEEVGMSAARLSRLSNLLAGYVEQERLAGAVTLVLRRGRVAFAEAVGWRDLEAGAPMQHDTLFRVASHTKAVVSVAAMMLHEEGRLLLSDPVARYLPEFAETKVAVARPARMYEVVRAHRPITILDLLTHTSGLGYGVGPAADAWRAAGLQHWYLVDREEPMASLVARMATLPFDAQPGATWLYGYSTDVLGVVVEKIAGCTLDDFLAARLFAPLQMRDTHFHVPPAKRERLAAVYAPRAGGGLKRLRDGTAIDTQGAYVDGPRRVHSGGAGLVSTASDYARFLQMLLGYGALDGTRLLSRKTVELMTANHLRGLEYLPGEGFGLGFWTVDDVAARGTPGSLGEYGWGGAYHTVYWVDPREQLIVVHLTQLLPAGEIDDHAKVRALVYQAIVD
jgi:CubicO group peptidase (beta-lactamase class C family)